MDLGALEFINYRTIEHPWSHTSPVVIPVLLTHTQLLSALSKPCSNSSLPSIHPSHGGTNGCRLQSRIRSRLRVPFRLGEEARHGRQKEGRAVLRVILLRRCRVRHKRHRMPPERDRRWRAPHREADQDLGDPRQVQEGEGAVVLPPRRDLQVLGWDRSEAERVVPRVRRRRRQGLCQCQSFGMFWILNLCSVVLSIIGYFSVVLSVCFRCFGKFRILNLFSGVFKCLPFSVV